MLRDPVGLRIIQTSWLRPFAYTFPCVTRCFLDKGRISRWRFGFIEILQTKFAKDQLNNKKQRLRQMGPHVHDVQASTWICCC